MIREIDWRSVPFPGGSEQEAEYEALNEWCAEYAAESLGASIAVEIGVWHGRTTLLLLQHFEHVLAIDTWAIDAWDQPPLLRGQAPSWKAFQRNIHRFGVEDHVGVICGTSQVLQYLPPFFATLCLIDGDHSTEWVLQDAYNVWSHVYPHGVLLFHDWKREDPDPFWGVARGVDHILSEGIEEYEEEDSLEYYLDKQRPGLCALKVKRKPKSPKKSIWKRLMNKGGEK